MPITGIESEHQNMRLLVQELHVNGVPVTPSAADVATLAGTLTGTTDGTIVDVAAIALATTNTYTDAAVNNAVNAAITSLNVQLKELQTKLNELIASFNASAG